MCPTSWILAFSLTPEKGFLCKWPRRAATRPPEGHQHVKDVTQWNSSLQAKLYGKKNIEFAWRLEHCCISLTHWHHFCMMSACWGCCMDVRLWGLWLPAGQHLTTAQKSGGFPTLTVNLAILHSRFPNPNLSFSGGPGRVIWEASSWCLCMHCYDISQKWHNHGMLHMQHSIHMATRLVFLTTELIHVGRVSHA